MDYNVIGQLFTDMIDLEVLAPTVSPTSMAEGDWYVSFVDGLPLTFTVSLSKPSVHDTIVDIEYLNVDGKGGYILDGVTYYSGFPTSLTIPSGEISTSITFYASGDWAVNGELTPAFVYLQVTGATTGGVAIPYSSAPAVCTLIDNEAGMLPATVLYLDPDHADVVASPITGTYYAVARLDGVLEQDLQVDVQLTGTAVNGTVATRYIPAGNTLRFFPIGNNDPSGMGTLSPVISSGTIILQITSATLSDFTPFNFDPTPIQFVVP